MIHNSEMANSRKRTAGEEWHHMQNKRNDFGAPSHQEAFQPQGFTQPMPPHYGQQQQAPPAFQHPMAQQEPMAMYPQAQNGQFPGAAPHALQNPMVQPAPARPLGEVQMNQQQQYMQNPQMAPHHGHSNHQGHFRDREIGLENQPIQQHHNGMQYQQMKNQPPMMNPQMNQYQMMPNNQINHRNPMPNPDMNRHDPMQNSHMPNSHMQNHQMQHPQMQYHQMQNRQMQNPHMQNAHMQNPHMQNPHMQNPHMQNPYMQNHQMQNPRMQNPHMQNPRMQNPQMQNPQMQNHQMPKYQMPNPETNLHVPMQNPQMNHHQMQNPQMNHHQMLKPQMQNHQMPKYQMPNPETNRHAPMQNPHIDHHAPMQNPRANQHNPMPNTEMNHVPMQNPPMNHQSMMQGSELPQNPCIPSHQVQHSQPNNQSNQQMQSDYYQDPFMQHPNQQMYPQNYGAPTEHTCLNPNLKFEPTVLPTANIPSTSGGQTPPTFENTSLGAASSSNGTSPEVRNLSLNSSVGMGPSSSGSSSFAELGVSPVNNDSNVEETAASTTVAVAKRQRKKPTRKIIDKEALKVERMLYNFNTGDQVVENCVGRLTSLGFVKRYNLRADEIRRRTNYPEFMNLSAVACIFRKAKVKGGSAMMRDMLEKDFGIVVKKCQRQNLKNTKFTCFVEEEALQFAQDLHKAAEVRFPTTGTGQMIAEMAAQHFSSEESLSIVNSFADMMACIQEEVTPVQPKLSGRAEFMGPDDEINNDIILMSARTHGFAVDNRKTAYDCMLSTANAVHGIALNNHAAHSNNTAEAPRHMENYQPQNYQPQNYPPCAVPPYPPVSNF